MNQIYHFSQICFLIIIIHAYLQTNDGSGRVLVSCSNSMQV